MKTSLIILLLFQGCIIFSKTFVRDYTYDASEMDSKISCRSIVTNELRVQLQNEIGSFVESEQIFSIQDLDGEYSENFSERIVTLCAGVTEFKILEEKWNGETYWMKASITVDEKDLHRKLKELSENREKVQELELTKIKLAQTEKELMKLKKEFKNSKNKEELEDRYKAGIAVLSSSEYFNRGLSKSNLNDEKGAIIDYTKAIELDLNYTLAYSNRAYSKSKLGDEKGAITDYSKAIELNPNYKSAYNN